MFYVVRRKINNHIFDDDYSHTKSGAKKSIKRTREFNKSHNFKGGN